VGGLLISQVLTLYTTPVIYLYMGKLGALFGRRHSYKEEPSDGEEEIAQSGGDA
jgi:hypothetical protein